MVLVHTLSSRYHYNYSYFHNEDERNIVCTISQNNQGIIEMNNRRVKNEHIMGLTIILTQEFEFKNVFLIYDCVM